MIGQERETEAMLAAYEPPAPPSTLRDRVLLRADAALTRSAVRDRWTRIYASRRLRAVWVATLICIVIAHVFLPRPNRHFHRDGFLIEAAWRSPELMEAVSVPRLHEGYASLDAFAYRQPSGRVPALAEPRRKEKSP